jgi:threonine/homoserine/homoserine lactone efflux protein
LDFLLLLRSLLIGFAIAAPVGPIGVLCIRRTLSDGRSIGLATGLGAATADACYGSIAAFSLTLVSDFLVNQATWIRLVGGLFLFYLGIKSFLAVPAEQAEPGNNVHIIGAYTSTFVLTLTNPMTILSFTAIFATLGAGIGRFGTGSAASMVLGIFCGSALWWFLLSGGTSILRSRLKPAALRWVNRMSGLAIIGFAIFLLVRLATSG